MNLRQKLSRKLKKTGGFTLIEMLIVVAIIAILVAVSIPMVTNSLEKARMSTDAANERAAKAAALADYMLTGKTTDQTYTYDAADGKVVPGNTYSGSGYGQCAKHKGGHLEVTVKENGSVEVKWAGGSGSDTAGTDLDSDDVIAPDSDSAGG